jgi:DNA-binding response OmpR family regulator
MAAQAPVQTVKNLPYKRIISSNVLLIEDDVDTAEMLSLLLLREGYGVRRSVTRDLAFAILDRYLYDVIIMDLYMPGMAAAEFIAHVRSRSPRTKFILITAADRAEQEAKALGISAWIGKPFQPEQLLEAIEKVMWK